MSIVRDFIFAQYEDEFSSGFASGVHHAADLVRGVSERETGNEERVHLEWLADYLDAAAMRNRL